MPDTNAIVAWMRGNGMKLAGDAAGALLILAAGAAAIWIMRRILAKAFEKTGKSNDMLCRFAVSVAVKVAWVLIALAILQRLGIDITPLVAGLGVTGFIVGFAFQETLGSFAAGMMIAVNRPFRPGDYVVAGGIEGTVLELNMMATVFATPDNKKIVAPNKIVWGSAITNFTALGKRRVDAKIGIAYGADVKKALAIAAETLKSVPGALQDPAPAVSVALLDDSAVVVNLRPWALCADYWKVYSASLEAVKKAFDDNGIAIPFPQIDVHMVN